MDNEKNNNPRKLLAKVHKQNKNIKELTKDQKEVDKLSDDVVNSIKFGKTSEKVEKLSEIVMKKMFKQDKRKLTLGQKTSDWLTKWAGSWFFIISFLIIIIIWMIVNTSWIIFGKAWDNYPFILLNLILSCLAAIQAPIILMSQNRQGQKDRLRAEYDYSVNRKAEKEIQEIKSQLNRIERKMK